MENLEKIYKERIFSKIEKDQKNYDEELKIKERKVNLARRFLDEISFLNNYGYCWEILALCNNGKDCCKPYYGWRVIINNRTIATSPFESIIVDEIDGEIKGKWEPTILGHGRDVDGSKDGWFTPKQLILALSR